MSDPAQLTASVLIANYNYGRFLEYAIDSALEQTWPNVQVVVVDDGSTDQSRMVLQTYGDAIRTVFKANGGQASSVNAGLPLLTGDAVIILDSDDMLDPTAVEKTISFFRDPDVVKVSWPLAIVDRDGHPTGEIRFRKLSIGNYRKRALRVGPASHVTPSGSGNMWRRSFIEAVSPIPENDLRGIVDAWLFSFSPFFGRFEGCEEPLTFYRVHGKNFTARYSAGPRLADWEHRAKYLHAWLTEQGESVSIQRWRKHNPFYQRLRGILRAEDQIGQRLPLDAPVALVAGRLFDRADIKPFRPVHRAPNELRHSDRTDDDFRDFIEHCRSAGIVYLAVQGPKTWDNTNLPAFAELLRREHTVLYEDDWIVIADAAADTSDVIEARPSEAVPAN